MNEKAIEAPRPPGGPDPGSTRPYDDSLGAPLPAKAVVAPGPAQQPTLKAANVRRRAGTLRLYEPQDLIGLEQRTKVGCVDSDAIRRLKELREDQRYRGPDRYIAKVPKNWERKLSDLRAQFPNFSEVVDYLHGAFALAMWGDKTPHIEPLLLDGPPGVGKSMFSIAFAKILGTTYVPLQMETAQTGSILCGSEAYWSNSQPGRLAQTLLRGAHANPVFLLDELEKTRGDDRFDPLAPLYALLEPEQAARFEDASYPGLRLNASRVIYIATSNRASDLPAPILDRLHVFSIAPPDSDGALRVARSIFEAVQKANKGARCIAMPGNEFLERLTELPPRSVRRAIGQAIARAARENRRELHLTDIPAPPPQRSIGFQPATRRAT